ncbi:hypothetical protein EGY09_07045 [Stenotrophomonas maltophilia]|nr:hypothetical protein EGY09_07045 [Stenotrophomonas maltophilia]
MKSLAFLAIAAACSYSPFSMNVREARMSLKEMGRSSSAVYKGTTYSAKGRFSVQGGYAAEYRIGLAATDPWVLCEGRFDSWEEALEHAQVTARAAIDKLQE